MNVKHSRSVLVNGVTLGLIGALLLGAASAALALPPSADLAQPRPTLTPDLRPTLTPAGPTPIESPTPQATPVPLPPSVADCESICGRVINLADSSGVSGTTVRFEDSGWGIDASTDSAGYYGYGRLGQDVGRLNVVLNGASEWHAVTHDIAFAPLAGRAVWINLGVYRGGRALRPLIVPVVSVSPEWAKPGVQVVFTVQVRNSLDRAISDVWVTNVLPAGLSLSGVSSTQGDVIRSGTYAAVNTAGLGAGEVMTVSIYADVNADAPTGMLNNTVSLFYSEHAAAQATARLYIKSDGPMPVAFPVTGHGFSVFGVGLGLGLTLWVIRRLRLRGSAMREGGSGGKPVGGL